MECLKVCDMAAERQRIIVPHCWKTGVGIAATMQMAAVTPHCQYRLCDAEASTVT